MKRDSNKAFAFRLKRTPHVRKGSSFISLLLIAQIMLIEISVFHNQLIQCFLFTATAFSCLLAACFGSGAGVQLEDICVQTNS